MPEIAEIARMAEILRMVSAAGLSGRWVAGDDLHTIGNGKGAYLLKVRLGSPVRIDIPRLGPAALLAGEYVYAGSARGSGGIRARLARHFRRDKRPHWHIDRLTVAAQDMMALVVPDGSECALVDGLLASDCFSIPVDGFGSTDCRRCASHLLSFCFPERRIPPVR